MNNTDFSQEFYRQRSKYFVHQAYQARLVRLAKQNRPNHLSLKHKLSYFLIAWGLRVAGNQRDHLFNELIIDTAYQYSPN